MDLDVVFFDLDGTLLDHRSAVVAALDGWLADFGRANTADLTSDWFALEDRHFPAARRGEITWAEQRRRRIREFYGRLGLRAPASDDAADEAFAAYSSGYEAAWSAYEDARPALLDVADRGLARAVVTNGNHAQQQAKMTATGLGDVCGPVMSSDELGVAKPDPGAFVAACGRMGVVPARALMVGDNHDLDVLAARAAGLRAVHLDRNASAQSPDSDRIFSLSELAALL